MKKLLLWGAGPHTKVVEAAKEMGIYTIVADYLEPSVYSPARLIADENLINNIFDVNELSDYCKENNVDGVLEFCIDPTQRPAKKIAENVGLPTFGNWEQTLALTDKCDLKKLCKYNNVDIIPEYTEKDIENKKVDFPVLVKPVDSCGSRGIAICDSYFDLEIAINNAKSES